MNKHLGTSFDDLMEEIFSPEQIREIRAEVKKKARELMTFEFYYKDIYLPLHTKFGTRALHFMGVFYTLMWIPFSLLTSPWLLLLTPFIVYLFAWPSHWWIEENKPAAYKNPIYAKLADFKMCYELLVGKLKWFQDG